MGDPWFGQKDYGIGLGPKSPAGWLALAVYIGAMTAVPPIVKHFEAPTWVTKVAFGGLTIGILILVFVKSDRRPWRWRWGGR